MNATLNYLDLCFTEQWSKKNCFTRSQEVVIAASVQKVQHVLHCVGENENGITSTLY